MTRPASAADMIWGGLVGVTLPREKMSARVGASIALASGSGLGVARDMDDYAHLAAAIARKKLRGPARAELAGAGSFDAVSHSARLVRALKAVYEVGGGFHVSLAAF